MILGVYLQVPKSEDFGLADEALCENLGLSDTCPRSQSELMAESEIEPWCDSQSGALFNAPGSLWEMSWWCQSSPSGPLSITKATITTGNLSRKAKDLNYYQGYRWWWPFTWWCGKFTLLVLFLTILCTKDFGFLSYPSNPFPTDLEEMWPCGSPQRNHPSLDLGIHLLMVKQ